MGNTMPQLGSVGGEITLVKISDFFISCEMGRRRGAITCHLIKCILEPINHYLEPIKHKIVQSTLLIKEKNMWPSSRTYKEEDVFIRNILRQKVNVPLANMC